MNCSWVRPALRVSSEMLLIMPARPPWIPRSPREQVEQTLVTPPGDHVQRTLSLGVAQVWVGAVAQEQLNVSPIAALLHQRVERGGALRVPEVHVGVVAEERLHLIAPRKGVSSSATGSRRAPAFTSTSMASTSS